MDSITQAALGAAVGVAVMGRRTAIWKSAAWGALAGTIPDLDVLIDHGDPVRNMVMHRAESHSLFWLSVLSVPLAALVARVSREWSIRRRWWLAIWLALITHPLLDAMTVYGTRLGLPFTDHPFAVGSMFIIDPLYTLPLIAGVLVALARGSPRACAAGLAVSTAYLAWSVTIQNYVERVARDSLAAQGIAAERVLVTPSAFNTIAWRVVAVGAEHYFEGFYSLLDRAARVQFDRFDRGMTMAEGLRGLDGFERIAAFSRGFYALRHDGRRLVIADLRMGQEPTYTFAFAIAEHASPLRPLAPPESAGRRPSIERLLPWLWRRIGGDPTPLPR